MRSHPRRLPLPLNKFEDLSLAMFSQLKFINPKSAVNGLDDKVKIISAHQPPTRSSPTICG
jgi:hypothetical protein